MAFIPQSRFWPGTRAILLVHGIGDASTGKEGAFPIDVVNAILGAEAANVAIYQLNYDFINDWMVRKVDFAAGITAMTGALKVKFGDDNTASVIAEYAGDVLWPVLSADIRFAVRDAFLAQLQQIQIDRGEAAFARGDDPLDYQVSIIAHSLGCFHTYEALTAAAEEPSHELQPASDLVTFDSVILMASPVQLIRSVAGAIQAIVPDIANLATLAKPLAIPSETKRGRTTRCTAEFISLTGTHDPVGGHLLGKKLEWAYMNIPDQKSIIVPQHALDIDTPDGTAAALAHAFKDGGPALNDPHSWTAYVEGQAKLLRGVVLT